MTLLNEADKIYFRGLAVDAVYGGAVKVWPASVVVPPPETHLLVSYDGTGPEYDSYAGNVGMIFGLTADMTFNQIGCRKGTGDITVPVTINVNDAGFAVVASAVVDVSGGTVGEFYYVDVDPFTLSSSVDYVLSASFPTIGNGQMWSGSIDCVINNKRTMTSCYFQDGQAPNAYTAEQSYVGFDLVFVSARRRMQND